MKKLMALCLVACIAGCVTTDLRQSAIREIPEEDIALVSSLSARDALDCANLLGGSAEKVEEIYGTPDSTGIISAGEESFSRMRYCNVKFMGEPADLQLDKHHQKVTQIKVRVVSMTAEGKEELIKQMSQDFGECHKRSPTDYQWNDKNGNIVNLSFPDSCVEVEFTSENWLEFVSRKPAMRVTVSEAKSKSEDIDIIQEGLRHLSTIGTETKPRPEDTDIIQEGLRHLSTIGEKKTCFYCKGTGKKDCIYCVDGKCSGCNGTGKYLGRKCVGCNGTRRCADCEGKGWKHCTFCNGTGKIR